MCRILNGRIFVLSEVDKINTLKYMMKRGILDIRTLITILLVILTLAGQKWSVLYNKKPGAQNLNFIDSPNSMVINIK
ncbi:MAG: hypothetical protein WBP08_09105 [Saprospiraceae bacterium]